jgi:50S ribosomal protein L16 3-hydroxylase
MLREWLEPTTLEDFVGAHLGRQAWARPGAALDALSMLDWPALGRLLERPALDLIWVARGQGLELSSPASLAEARAQLAVGIGFVIRRAERHDAELARLARHLVRDLPGRAQIQLFVTPGGTHGFGWHYDAEHVFIVQTAGVKDYFFRENTVTRETPHAVRYDFGRFRDETSPLQIARLLPGDVLYLPALWWHMAQCVEDSLSISLGVLRE